MKHVILASLLGLATLMGVEGASAAQKGQPVPAVLPAGAHVTRVYPGSPAARAGLEPGDVILEIDGILITRRQDYFRLLRIASFQGASVELTVNDKNARNGPPVTLEAEPRNGELGIEFEIVRQRR
jgi:S1-C subfamily serine protease